MNFTKQHQNLHLNHQKPKYGSLTRGTRRVNGLTGQREQSRGAAVDPCLRASGEDADEAKGTDVLATTRRTQLCPPLNRYRAQAMTAACMADGGGNPTVLQRGPAM